LRTAMAAKYVAAAAMLMLPGAAATSMQTCGELKAFYKSQQCCGMPSKMVTPPLLGCDSTVTRDMVTAAQQAWGNGIVAIASAYTNGQNYTQTAVDHIETLYGYGFTPVLFKPTLAAEMQFRSTFAGALSYFVATNGEHEEDGGFAIKGWTAVRFENDDIIVSGSTAVAMGNYFFTKPDGDEVKVEYTFGYFLDSEGLLRINVHHSALPYPFQISRDMVIAAQTAWGNGIVAIAKAHTDGDNFTQVAVDHINNLYGYGMGTVLFKPTLAAAEQFRPTFDDALSYFVGNGHVSEDSGFAIKGWTAVRFENADDIILAGPTAMAMGNYFFTKPGDPELKVEYSFGYFLDKKGDVRINLHHSSKPYVPE